MDRLSVSDFLICVRLLNKCLSVLSALKGTKASPNTNTLAKREHCNDLMNTNVRALAVAPDLYTNDKSGVFDRYVYVEIYMYMCVCGFRHVKNDEAALCPVRGRHCAVKK